MTDLSKPPTPFLRPPDGETKAKEGSTSRLVIVPAVLCLVMLLIMIVAVIWLLPQKKAPLPEPTTAGTALMQRVDDSFSEKEKQEAQELLQKWLTLQVRAEADNVALWGRDEYALIRQTVVTADNALQHHAFKDAKNKYNSAVLHLQELLSQKDTILETALKTGNTALLQNKSTIAAEAFQRALAIDPDNDKARKGARQAAVRDQVNVLFAEALEREEEGKPASALAVLTELVALDEDYTPALEAKERIAGLLEDATFQETMTLFLTSLERNDLKAARKAYTDAKVLRSDDPAVNSAAKRLVEAEETAQLQALRKKAEQQRNDERWTDALATYTASLNVALQAIFAVNGRREAKKRAELDSALESILSHPERLQEDGPLDEAEQVLDYAGKNTRSRAKAQAADQRPVAAARCCNHSGYDQSELG